MTGIMIYSAVHFKNLANKLAQQLLKSEKCLVLLPTKFMLDDPYHISCRDNDTYMEIDKDKLKLVDYLYVINTYGFLDWDTITIVEKARQLNIKVKYIEM